MGIQTCPSSLGNSHTHHLKVEKEYNDQFKAINGLKQIKMNSIYSVLLVHQHIHI